MFCASSFATTILANIRIIVDILNNPVLQKSLIQLAVVTSARYFVKIFDDFWVSDLWGRGNLFLLPQSWVHSLCHGKVDDISISICIFSSLLNSLYFLRFCFQCYVMYYLWNMPPFDLFEDSLLNIVMILVRLS